VHRKWCDYKESYLHLKDWLKQRPFRYQGRADLNAYKLFLELAHSILRNNGLLCFIVPSGIYSDLGARDLRRLFLDENRWRTIIGFENRNGMFAIHRSFKFCLVAVQKGGETDRINASFMLSEIEKNSSSGLSLPRSSLCRFSPHALSIIEFEGERDLKLLDKIYNNCKTLDSASAWNIEFERELDMTNDSHLFVPRAELEANGFRPDIYGHWLSGRWRPADGACANDSAVPSQDRSCFIYIGEIEDIALPLCEGRMVGQFDYSEKGWVSGRSRRAVWQEMSFADKRIMPQYLVPARHYPRWREEEASLKCGFLGVGSATNSRSMIASLLDSLPCGNSVPVLRTDDWLRTLHLAACLNSYVFDFALRLRLAGNNLNYFVVGECPLPDFERISVLEPVAEIVARLNLCGWRFAPHWLRLKTADEKQVYWCEADHERRQLRAMLDAIIACAFGIDRDDLAWILRGTGSDSSSRPLKGFWRSDRHLPQAERHSSLTMDNFARLEQIGLTQFCRETSRFLTEETSHRFLSTDELEVHGARLSSVRSRSREL
jgi:hypothetical protein